MTHKDYVHTGLQLCCYSRMNPQLEQRRKGSVCARAHVWALRGFVQF